MLHAGKKEQDAPVRAHKGMGPSCMPPPPHCHRRKQARHWVANHLSWPDGSIVQVFEVNIRILGGLLSAYYLSGGDEMFLNKAEELGLRLAPAFKTSSGLPIKQVQVGAGSRPVWRMSPC